MQRPFKIALVGYGKIAKDQHIPSIEANADFELVCVVSQSVLNAEVPVFQTLNDAFESDVEIDAVILCTPPSVRVELALLAFQNGCAVMLEKPPAISVALTKEIASFANEYEQVVFATWHSRYAAMVEEAAGWLKSHKMKCARIIWHESVHKWHPGQTWLWEKGAFGVFDMGINALSILTYINPADYRVTSAHFEIPENRNAPVAVQMQLESEPGVFVDISLDFLAGDDEVWTIEIETDDGHRANLFDGGAGFVNSAGTSRSFANQEYQRLYERFSQLLTNGARDLDVQPLEIVEQAFQQATHHLVANLDFD